MKVLIVAKTRRGAGACVGGITASGESVRMILPPGEQDPHAGLEYGVGEVWEIDSSPASPLIPPHVENVFVHGATRLRRSDRVNDTIHRFMKPVTGGPENLFEGLVRATPAGGLYIAKPGVPLRSTMFWMPDQPLQIDLEGKRIRYRYPGPDGGRTVTFVGFQEPVPEIPVGTLLRISLAHWWRPSDRSDEELRCFVQLSGWFMEPGSAQARKVSVTGPAIPQAISGFGSKAAILDRAGKVMKQTFGFSEFLPSQADVIARVLQQEATLVVMPTGSGKSLCYQLPALLFDGLTVVVSPLVALMQDQISQLRLSGVLAACLNHTVPLVDYQTTMGSVRNGQIKLLYVAPETLLRPEILLLLEQSRLSCLAVDEAHCISEWGHDFRLEYRQLSRLRARFPGAVCLALTATATARVRQDIRRLLEIPAQGEFVASFNRPNLFLAVENRHDRLAQVLAFLEKRRGQSGIVYCGTRKQADDLCASLCAHGWPALSYHAGMMPEDRRRNHEQFIAEEARIMVATIAFGMGINKANIRFVVHAHTPKNIENYYQEIGRAGRDGLPAHCLLLHSNSDAVLHRRFLEQGAPSERKGREERLRAMLRFAEACDCRRKALLAYFEEEAEERCGTCDNCVRKEHPGEETDATQQAKKVLSCVRATGQVFGANHIVGILRGSRASKLLRQGHDQLSDFGSGKDVSAAQWQALIQKLVERGILGRSMAFGSLELSSAGRQVLENEAKVMLPPEFHEPPASPQRPVEQHDPDLFAKLREVRRAIAERERVPAFLIFPDRSLMEMAASMPRNSSEFLAITGVGQLKLANYGAEFMRVICEYGPKNDAQTPKVLVQPCSPVTKKEAGTRSIEVANLFDSGRSVAEIAAQFGIQPTTVLHHLHRFVTSGGKLDPNQVLALSALSKEQRDEVLEQFRRMGDGRLGPIYMAMNRAVPYDELHILRLYLLASRSKQA